MDYKENTFRGLEHFCFHLITPHLRHRHLCSSARLLVCSSACPSDSPVENLLLTPNHALPKHTPRRLIYCSCLSVLCCLCFDSPLVFRRVSSEGPVRLTLRGVAAVGVIEQLLDAKEDLLHSDRRFPIVLRVEDAARRREGGGGERGRESTQSKRGGVSAKKHGGSVPGQQSKRATFPMVRVRAPTSIYTPSLALFSLIRGLRKRQRLALALPEADSPRRVHVWVKDDRGELAHRRLAGIVLAERHRQLEQAALPVRLSRAPHLCESGKRSAAHDANRQTIFRHNGIGGVLGKTPD